VSGSAASFDHYHRSKGWDSIGYHFVINNGKTSDGYMEILDGQIEQGRSIGKDPAAVRGYNHGMVAICVVGSKFNDFTILQKLSLVKLIEDLSFKYKIKQINIMGHRDYPNVNKDCPCMNIKGLIDDMYSEEFSNIEIAQRINDVKFN
jgi:hypothetical protein